MRGEIRVVEDDETWWDNGVVKTVKQLATDMRTTKHEECLFKSFRKTEKILSNTTAVKLLTSNFVEAKLELIANWWREWKKAKESNLFRFDITG